MFKLPWDLLLPNGGRGTKARWFLWCDYCHCQKLSLTHNYSLLPGTVLDVGVTKMERVSAVELKNVQLGEPLICSFILTTVWNFENTFIQHVQC